MKCTTKVTLLSAVCCAALAIAPAAASAQAAPPEASIPPADQQPAALAAADQVAPGDIVVTAQKRAERLKDVPASVAVLGGESLQRQGADTLEDYVARVPGLTLNARNVGQQQLTIRGISTGAGFASTVATYIDDAPVGSSNGNGTGGLITPEIDSIDLARVEVLRGPQGTLYGASNIGGLVKYVTVTPDLYHVEGVGNVAGVTAAHGDEGYAVRGRVSVPVVEGKLAVLASGYVRRDPGFVDDDVQQRRNLDALHAKGFRLALQARPVDDLTINLAAIGTDKNADGFTQIDANGATLQPLYGDYVQRRPRNSTYQTTHVRLYYGTAAYDLGFAQLSSTTSYNTVFNRSSEDDTQLFSPFFPQSFGKPNLGYTGNYLIKQNKLTEEVRLSGKLGTTLDWIVGGYYTRENSNTGAGFNTLDAITGQPVDIGLLLLKSTIFGRYRELAGFGQGTLHLTSKLDITGGVRYAHNRQNDTTVGDGIFAGGPTTVTTRARGSATTFTVAPQYKITPDVTLYARVATGYRPGGSNSITAPRANYDPDRTTNYEGGIKGSLDGGRLSFDLDGFYVDWSQIQLAVVSPQGLGYTANVGKASSRGVEANVSYRLLQGWSLGATGSYIDAHLDRDLPTGQFGVKGDPLPYSPKWKVAAQTDYQQNLGGDIQGFVGGSLYYTDDVRGEFRNVPGGVRPRLPGYVTVDGRLGINRGPLSLSLIGKNLFDKRGYNGVTQLTQQVAGPVALNIIQPRTLTLELRFNY